MLDLGVLGPLAVSVDGTPVELTRPSVRRLLATLALRADRVVSIDELTDLLWAGEPPSTAGAVVRNGVAQLRRQLGAHSIERAVGGYRLTPLSRLDAVTFVAAAEQATTAIQLRAALNLWHGDPWQEIMDDPLRPAAAARLEAVRRGAELRRIGFLLLEGDVSAARAEATAFRACGETDDISAALAMAAAHLSGETRTAMRIGYEHRRRLASEAGLEPGPAFADLEAAVAGLDAEAVLALVRRALAVEGTQRSGGTTGNPVPTPLAGRRAELALLADAGARARLGHDGAVSISGEPGIGKTTLLSAAARRLGDGGAQVVSARCEEDGDALHEPMASIVAQLLERADPATREEQRRSFGDVLVHLLPSGHALRSTLDSGGGLPTSSTLLAEAARALFHRASAGASPLVLMLDDLQWAHEEGLQLLRAALGRSGSAGSTRGPILVVVAYRHTELVEDHPLRRLLADLQRSPGLRHILLEGIDAAAVRQLAPRLTSDQARRLVDATAGNPLFIVHLLADLDDDADLEAESGSSVATLVSARLSRLSAPCRRVLSVAATAGERFDVAIVEQAVLGKADDPSAVHESLDEAVSAGIIGATGSSPGTLRFVHAVVRHSVLDTLPVTRLRHNHVLLADAYRLLDPAGSVLQQAEHLCAAAAPSMIERAIATSAAAGRYALRHLAPDTALHVVRRALTLAGDDPSEPLHSALGWLRLVEADAHIMRGDIASAHTSFDALAALKGAGNDLELLVEAVVSSSWVYLADTAAQAMATRADVLATEAESSAWRALLHAYDLIRRSRMMEQGLEHLGVGCLASARAAGAPRALAAALVARTMTRFDDRTPDDVTLLDEAVEILNHQWDAPASQQAEVRLQRALARLRHGDRPGAEDDLNQLERLARHHHLERFRRLVVWARAVLAHASGRLDDGDRLLAAFAREHAEHIGRTPLPLDGCTFTAQLRRYGTADTHLLTRHELTVSYWIAVRDLLLAEHGCARGDLAPARATLRRYAANDLRAVPRTWMTPLLLWHMVLVCEDTNDRQSAAALLPLMAPFRGTTWLRVLTFWHGAFDSAEGRLLLVLQRPVEAAAALERGVALERKLGADSLACATLEALGRARAELGDSTGATSALREALAMAKSIGLEPLIGRCSRQLGIIAETV